MPDLHQPGSFLIQVFSHEIIEILFATQPRIETADSRGQRLRIEYDRIPWRVPDILAAGEQIVHQEGVPLRDAELFYGYTDIALLDIERVQVDGSSSCN